MKNCKVKELQDKDCYLTNLATKEVFIVHWKYNYMWVLCVKYNAIFAILRRYRCEPNFNQCFDRFLQNAICNNIINYIAWVSNFYSTNLQPYQYVFQIKFNRSCKLNRTQMNCKFRYIVDFKHKYLFKIWLRPLINNSLQKVYVHHLLSHDNHHD